MRILKIKKVLCGLLAASVITASTVTALSLGNISAFASEEDSSYAMDDPVTNRIYDGSCTLRVGSAKAEPGGTVAVPVYMELDENMKEQYITGMAFKVKYDKEALTLQRLMLPNPCGVANGTFSSSKASGVYIYMFKTENITVDPTLPVCEIRFKVNEGAQEGAYEIDLVNHLYKEEYPVQVIHTQELMQEATFLTPEIKAGSVMVGKDFDLGEAAAPTVDANGKVTWEAVKNATSYKVFKVLGDKTYSGSETTDNFYQFKSVPTTDYQVYYEAYDGEGNTVTSEAVTVKGKKALGKPSKVAVDKNGNVTWKAASGASYYKVYKTTNATYGSGKVYDTSYTFKNVPKKDYVVQVAAFDENDKSATSGKVYVHVGASDIIKNISVENGVVTWDKVDGAVSYRVYKVTGARAYAGKAVTEEQYEFNSTPASDYQVFVNAVLTDGTVVTSELVNVKA